MATKLVNPPDQTSTKPASRDVRLDAFRGLMIVLMLLNHTPTCLHDFTLDYLGYISEAEGFVFLSGFVLGLAYTRISFRQSDASLWRRALLRARTIYLCHIYTLVLVFVLLKAFVKDQGDWAAWTWLIQQNPFKGILLCGSLLYQPRFFDILPMYIVFILAAPWLIEQVKRNNGLRVILGSLGVWAMAQGGLRKKLWACFPARFQILPGYFDIFAWQLLFICGLYAGYLCCKNGWKPSWIRRKIVIGCAIALVGVLFLCRQNLIFGKDIITMVERWTNKDSLGLVRLLNFSAIVTLVACVYSYLRVGVAGRMLAYLGRHSLIVFCCHLPLVVCMNLILPRLPGLGESSKALILMLCLGSLYLPAWICERSNTFTTRHRTYEMNGEASKP